MQIYSQKAISIHYLQIATVFLLALASHRSSAEPSEIDECVLNEFEMADSDTTVGELRSICGERMQESRPLIVDPADADEPASLILERLNRERTVQENRSVLTPHRRNYVLPFSYVGSPNVQPYRDAFGDVVGEDQLNHFEAKFQLSLKVTIADSLFTDRDALYFGFTTQSYWQAFNDDISSPFRETNYEPEIFWATPIAWWPFEVDASLLTVGLVHQSNGRSLPLSRSWNRIYANFIWEKNDFVLSFKPWWRMPEDDKNGPFDPGGDDNPDIDDFMGHFEFATVFRRNDHELGLTMRNNFGTDRGAAQLEWTFPLWGRFRGYAQYFNGYGESLIDYNARIKRLGVGILLTDLL